MLPPFTHLDFPPIIFYQIKTTCPNELKGLRIRRWLRKEKKTRTQTTWLPLNLNYTDTPLLVKIGQVAVEVKPDFDPKLLLDVVKTLLAQNDTCSKPGTCLPSIR